MKKSLLRCVKRCDRGFALVIVLAAIVLLLFVILGFFLRVQSELQSSSAFQTAESGRNLADYAVNLVEAQIKTGTASQDEVGNPLAWASQPGAIRTYDTSGNLVSVYKLYSCNAAFSDTGMVSKTIDPSKEAAALNNWASNNAFFTDLNEPLNNKFPILDPAGLGTVKGFSVTGAPTSSIYNPQVPMPGAWLYVLRDGTVLTPTGTGSVAQVSGATDKNPIVGRIAFWTDDESCKINLNTAGGGPWDEQTHTTNYSYDTDNTAYIGPGFSGFWSLPIAAHSRQECALSLTQPVLGEYQRYPGHPANTYVSAAFPEFADMDALFGTGANSGLLPRLQNEGSKGGTVATATKVNLDTDRLYASADEVLFQPSRTENSSVTDALANRSNFFVTTVGRSPDVNLFSRPRISIWPITKASANTTDTSKMTAYDKLIAFCETINTVPYYFCRMDPGSATTDLDLLNNKKLLSYLRNEVTKPVPGFGGPSGILGKHTGEANQITTEILDYIRSTNTRDTSMGGSRSVLYKYSYTSKTASALPTGAVVPIYDGDTNTRGLGRFPILSKIGIIFSGVAINRPGGTPSATDRYAPGFKIGPPKDTGDDDLILAPDPGFLKMRAMLVFEMFNPGAGYGQIHPRLTMQVDTTGFQWGGGGSMFANTTGTFAYTEDSWEKSRLATPIGGRISCQEVADPFYGDVSLSIVKNEYDPVAKKLKYDAPRTFTVAKDYPFLGLQGNDSPQVAIGTPFPFGGGKLTVTIKDEGGRVIQTIKDIEFPAATLPAPDIAPIDRSLNVDLRLPQLRLRYKNAGASSVSADTAALISEADTVRSVSIQPADFRQIAAVKDVPGKVFKTIPVRYADSNRRLAHNLFLSYNTAHLGAALGGYGGPSVQSAITTPADKAPEKSESDFYTALLNGYYVNKSPLAEGSWTQSVSASGDYFTYLAETESLDGAKITGTSLMGDWDNAAGMIPDGPYSNLPDEINAPVSGDQTVPYFGKNMINSGYNTTTFASYFTPNRMMPSAVMLGSLPTGVPLNDADLGRPWQTLLFRPSKVGHPGLASPPDYLLLDLFSMPIVEPYAISEPLSTAGRINMNYQILPYTYITRSTGVQAVLRSEQMMVLDNNTDAHSLKLRQPVKDKVRWKLDLSDTTGTLKGFKDRFNKKDIFRSPSEICSIWLVPDGAPGAPTYDMMSTWWDDYITTGDNTKESSYARIYPRLTTKSNTFTVHYRVQALKKVSGSGTADTWSEGKDKVGAEYRGATTVERYIDPTDSSIPNYTEPANYNAAPLDSLYKFRILSQKQFNP